jgi:hypothetical protein
MKQKKHIDTAELAQEAVTTPRAKMSFTSLKGLLKGIVSDRKKTVTATFIVAIVLSIGTTLYFYKQLSDVKRDPQKVAQAEAAALIGRVSKIIELPQGEQPTIATVTDPDKLRTQSFFARAKRGDKVLIFTNSRKAILYDPVANKIVEAAPIDIGNNPLTTPTTPSTSPPSSK